MEGISLFGKDTDMRYIEEDVRKNMGYAEAGEEEK